MFYGLKKTFFIYKPCNVAENNNIFRNELTKHLKKGYSQKSMQKNKQLYILILKLFSQ